MTLAPALDLTTSLRGDFPRELKVPRTPPPLTGFPPVLQQAKLSILLASSLTSNPKTTKIPRRREINCFRAVGEICAFPMGMVVRW